MPGQAGNPDAHGRGVAGDEPEIAANHASGKFAGFGEAHSIEADKVKGRFAEFLPEKYPSLEEQHKAKELLQMVVQGVKHERGQERGMSRF